MNTRPGGHGPAARDGVRTPAPTLPLDLPPLDDHETEWYFGDRNGWPGDSGVVGAVDAPACDWSAWTDAPFDRVCLALSCVTKGGGRAS